VKNTNLLLEKLKAMLSEGKDSTPEYAELKRRFGWEFNGMRLHEYYFGNLGAKVSLDETTALYKKITEEFGSFQLWKQDFMSIGKMRGIGWVMLYMDPSNSKLMNVWINEHDAGHISGAKPILVMDVFEHAYMTDYQLDKAKYIDVFLNNINWEEVRDRFDKQNA